MRDLLARLWQRRRPGQAAIPLHVGDPRFDDWDVVRDFADIGTARSWCHHLTEAGIEAVITSDWPLDRFNRGDIALRAAPGRWSEAEEFLDNIGLDEPDDDY